eukprot:5925860-Pleurochrysis_carterae.AAC.3
MRGAGANTERCRLVGPAEAPCLRDDLPLGLSAHASGKPVGAPGGKSFQPMVHDHGSGPAAYVQGVARSVLSSYRLSAGGSPLECWRDRAYPCLHDVAGGPFSQTTELVQCMHGNSGTQADDAGLHRAAAHARREAHLRARGARARLASCIALRGRQTGAWHS